MKNDKCSMLNDKCSGFALITVTFMLVTLISLVFLTAYLAVSQKRDIAKEYFINMRGLELKRAVFGRLAEQRGGKFTSCTGLYSELGSHHHYAYPGYRYTYRVFSKRMHQGREGIDDLDYRYDSDYGLWAGYRGSSYYHISPCDESYYSSDERPSYEVFGKSFGITDTCHRAHIIRYYFNDGKMRFIGRDRYLIKVKDYTKTAGNKISLELVSAETGKTLTPRCAVRSLTSIDPLYEYDAVSYNFVTGSDTMLLPTQTEDLGEYKLYSFLLGYDPLSGAGRRRTSTTGLIKVVIRKKENGNWNTVFTQPIVVPAKYYDDMGAYVEEIEYYG